MSWTIPYELISVYKRRALIGVGAFLLLWILFFDSHSVYSRLNMHQERARLTEENATLRANITSVEASLDRPLTDEEVETIAREKLGMTRPGEVVYPVIERP